MSKNEKIVLLLILSPILYSVVMSLINSGLGSTIITAIVFIGAIGAIAIALGAIGGILSFVADFFGIKIGRQ